MVTTLEGHWRLLRVPSRRCTDTLPKLVSSATFVRLCLCPSPGVVAASTETSSLRLSQSSLSALQFQFLVVVAELCPQKAVLKS